jgi:putative ABC transport system ATP-binding protein
VTTTGFALHLAGVRKTFRPGNAAPITAVDNASLDLAAGDTAALTGPSGSGKSTLLHLLGAIDAADSGTIEVGGTDITGLGRGRLAAYRATIGFVFQKFHLLPALSARDNVIAPALPHRRHLSFDPAARAQQLLEAVGLGDRSRALPSQLSGGQQQRVAIARAIVSDPKLLLCDEPTGDLDRGSADEILLLLQLLNRDLGKTIVMVTHDPVAARYARRVLHLDKGKFIENTELAA